MDTLAEMSLDALNISSPASPASSTSSAISDVSSSPPSLCSTSSTSSTSSSVASSEDDNEDEHDEHDDDDKEDENHEDDDFLVMTAGKPHVHILTRDEVPVFATFDETRLIQQRARLIQQISVEYHAIGTVYVDPKDETITVLTVKPSNQILSTERVIARIGTFLVDCM